MYIAYPVAVGIVDALANVASVIGEQGSSPHVVIMGSGAADPNSPSGIARAHALSEELLLKLGVNFTAVRVEGMRADPASRSCPATRSSVSSTPSGTGENLAGRRSRRPRLPWRTRRYV